MDENNNWMTCPLCGSRFYDPKIKSGIFTTVVSYHCNICNNMIKARWFTINGAFNRLKWKMDSIRSVVPCHAPNEVKEEGVYVPGWKVPQKCTDCEFENRCFTGQCSLYGGHNGENCKLKRVVRL